MESMSFRIPARQPQKRIATIFLLPDCDLACRFCASDLGFDRMDFAQAQNLISQLAASGYESVVLGGGEPLLWEGGLIRLAQHAKSLGLITQLNTNGVAWTEELLNNHAIDRVILPLDGAIPATHDWLRKPRGGHFELVQSRLKDIQAAGKEATIGTVICANNMDEIPQLARGLDSLVESGLKIHAWHLYRFRPVGRGGAVQGREAELGLSEAEFKWLCKPLQATDRSFRIYRRPDMTSSREVDFLWFDKGALQTGFHGQHQSVDDLVKISSSKSRSDVAHAPIQIGEPPRPSKNRK